MDRLPPLTALRAFDAAARHMSFAKAAAELNVTPGALSFQIKSLEEHLGQPLFRRLNRAVELTAAGRALAPGAAAGFETLNAAWRAARRTANSRALTVTAGPAFTAKWLAPRLFAFAQAHPDIELRFVASLRIMDFERDEVDLAIRFGQSHDDGLFSRPILREIVLPVMAPELAGEIRTPEDLARAPLIEQTDILFLDPPIDWPAWFRAAGLTPPVPSGPRFSQADHALDAAAAGAGVALARLSLAFGQLREGRLVAPFDMALETDAQFRLTCPQGNEVRPAVRDFMDWIGSEAEGVEAMAADKRLVHAADVPR
ncbi:transcriptional regulator GcvA [Rhodobacteraceae bacterium CCMM004]|nr:transcriptional regulator GcvA [Rhodobacteraceae bacterium CCMM004]